MKSFLSECKNIREKANMRLSGWRRLWVFMSAIYFIVVVAYSFYTFPKPENIVHKNEFYEKLSSKSLDIIVERGHTENISTANHDITEVEMPNGHIIRFSSKALQKDMENVSAEYWSIIGEEVRQLRVKFVFYGFLFWFIPCIFLYALGWGMGWVYRGFKKKDVQK